MGHEPEAAQLVMLQPSEDGLGLLDKMLEARGSSLVLVTVLLSFRMSTNMNMGGVLLIGLRRTQAVISSRLLWTFILVVGASVFQDESEIRAEVQLADKLETPRRDCGRAAASIRWRSCSDTGSMTTESQSASATPEWHLLETKESAFRSTLLNCRVPGVSARRERHRLGLDGERTWSVIRSSSSVGTVSNPLGSMLCTLHRQPAATRTSYRQEMFTETEVLRA